MNTAELCKSADALLDALDAAGYTRLSPDVMAAVNALSAAVSKAEGGAVSTAKTASLPDDYVATDKIGQMAVGESGWTVPWAMEVDENKRCWLNPDHTFHHHPGGTVSMHIKRGADGYEVDPPPGYTWYPRGESRAGLLPVAHIGEQR